MAHRVSTFLDVCLSGEVKLHTMVIGYLRLMESRASKNYRLITTTISPDPTGIKRSGLRVNPGRTQATTFSTLYWTELIAAQACAPEDFMVATT